MTQKDLISSACHWARRGDGVLPLLRQCKESHLYCTYAIQRQCFGREALEGPA